MSEDARARDQLRRGDGGALVELYDRHATAAYSLAVRLVGAAEAEDVVHDVFATLLGNHDLYDPARGAFRPWLLRVVHNRCVNVLRRRRSAGEEALAWIEDPADSPPDAVIASLEASAVRDQLQRLPTEQREALVLAYYGGLTHSQLARRLALPLGTVKARLRRGLLALRARLTDTRLGVPG